MVIALVLVTNRHPSLIRALYMTSSNGSFSQLSLLFRLILSLLSWYVPVYMNSPELSLMEILIFIQSTTHTPTIHIISPLTLEKQSITPPASIFPFFHTEVHQ